MPSISHWKVAATLGGAALTASAVWLNAQHVAQAEGLASPLVLASVITTICAAMTPPFAERYARGGEWFKAICLWLFFVLAVAFSLSVSIGRAGGHRDAEVAEGETVNTRAQIAREAYESALADVREACPLPRGRCRRARAALSLARAALGSAPAARTADPAAQRIASILHVSEASVALYQPLALPFALELGGFIFLAVGLSPRRKERRKPIQVAMAVRKPVAITTGFARPAAIPLAKPDCNALQTWEKPGTRAYFLQRLQREHPQLAHEVECGAMSVFAASVAAGMRKRAP